MLNQTGAPICVFAWELQSSHLVDAAPTLTIAPEDGRVLVSGASRPIRLGDVSGEFEFGDDLRFFLYEVLGERAEFRSTVTFSAEELRASGNRVTFSGF